MNILQTEDLVKGFPDERLLKEAQAPSGEIPQFLLVSEVQRRKDMRDRFKQEQAQMPEGTISDQILNQGIMGTQPQPQRQPPPNQPFPLPQGQGIAPNPNQFPPPQPPNAEIAPQMPQMAAGGVVGMTPRIDPNRIPQAVQAMAQKEYVGMAGGGTFAAPWNGMTRDINTTGYPTDQVAWEEFLGGRNAPVGDARETQGRTTNEISFNPDGSLRETAEQFMPTPIQRGNDAVTSENTGIAAIANREPPKDIYSTVSLGGDLMNELNSLDDAVYNMMPERLQSELTAMNPLRPESDTYANNIASEGTGKDRVYDDFDPLFAAFDLSNKSGFHWTDGSKENQQKQAPTLEESQAAQIAEEAALEQQNLAALNSPDSGGITDLTSVKENPQLQGFSDPQVQANPNNSAYEDYMAKQQKMAYSNALMQLGAGIAGNNLSGGISKAGTALMQGQKMNDTVQAQMMRNASMDDRLDRTLAQRDRETAARVTSGSADIRTSQWFLDLSPENRRIIMRLKGRELPEEMVRRMLSETIIEREGQGIPMSQEEQDALMANLSGINGVAAPARTKAVSFTNLPK